ESVIPSPLEVALPLAETGSFFGQGVELGLADAVLATCVGVASDDPSDHPVRLGVHSAPAWVDLGARFHGHLDPTIEVPGGVSTAPGSGREPGRGRPGRASSGIEAGLPGVELVLQGDGHGGDGPVGGDGAGPPDIGALALDV